MNALKHGSRSRATIHKFQRVRYVLRLSAENIKLVRLAIRLRRPQIRYKPWYVRLSEAQRTRLPMRFATLHLAPLTIAIVFPPLKSKEGSEHRDLRPTW